MRMFATFTLLFLACYFSGGAADHDICYACISLSSDSDQPRTEPEPEPTEWPQWPTTRWPWWGTTTAKMGLPLCNGSRAHEGVECPDNIGCESLWGQVEYYYEGEFRYFHVMYRGCLSTFNTNYGCTYDGDEVLNYLRPHYYHIAELLGFQSEWTYASGEACACYGDLCNGAPYVKISVILSVGALLFSLLLAEY